MKKTPKFLIILLLPLLFTSCFKKIVDTIVPDGSATVVFDGKSTKLKNPTAVTVLGLVTIVGGDKVTGFTVVLNKTEIKTGKTYDLKNGLGVFTYLHDGTPYIPSSGTLEITNYKDNSIVEGKFSFEGSPIAKTDKTKISGTFEVKIIL